MDLGRHRNAEYGVNDGGLGKAVGLKLLTSDALDLAINTILA